MKQFVIGTLITLILVLVVLAGDTWRKRRVR
jgi:hypothetical protein